MDDNKQLFTEEEAKKVLDMLEDYERSKWLGHLMWKLTIAVGAVVAGFAAFRENIFAIFQRH